MSIFRSALTIGTLGYGARAAKSGNPMGYFMRTAKGSPVTKHLLQRTALPTLAHMEARIRKGFVPDATHISAAVIDPLLGHAPSLVGEEFMKMHNAKPMSAGWFGKQVLKHAINDDGTYNIKGIERMLHAGKRSHDAIEAAAKLPIHTSATATGALAGGAAGYLTGDEETKKGRALKGALMGGGLGLMGGRKLSKAISNVRESEAYKMLPKIHHEYTSSPYWREQLEASNSPLRQFVGKNFGKLVTSVPEKRFARMQTSDASLAWHADRFNMGKFKDFVRKAKTSFRSAEGIRRAYPDAPNSSISTPLGTHEVRGKTLTEKLMDNF